MALTRGQLQALGQAYQAAWMAKYQGASTVASLAAGRAAAGGVSVSQAVAEAVGKPVTLIDKESPTMVVTARRPGERYAEVWMKTAATSDLPEYVSFRRAMPDIDWSGIASGKVAVKLPLQEVPPPSQIKEKYPQQNPQLVKFAQDQKSAQSAYDQLLLAGYKPTIALSVVRAAGYGIFGMSHPTRKGLDTLQLPQNVMQTLKTHEGKDIEVGTHTLLAISRLSPRQQFAEYQGLGIIGRGSKFVPGEKADGWGWLTPDQVKAQAEFEKGLRRQPQELQDAYKRGGIEEYNRIAEKLQGYFVESLKTQPQELQNAYEKGGIVEYNRAVREYNSQVKQEQKAFESNIKKNYPELYVVYKEQGYGAFQKEVDKQQQRQGDALATVADYKVPGSKDEYNIVQFLRENPDKESTLIVAGFDTEEVAKAKGIAELPYSKITPFETWWDKVAKAGGAGKNIYEFTQFLRENPSLAEEGQKLALTPATEPVSKPDMSLQQFTAEFMAARGITGESSREEQQAAQELAMIQYGRVYGGGELAKSGVVGIASILFPPTRVAYPEIKLKDIKALEWAIGSVNVALIATPFLPAAVAGKAIVPLSGIAGGVFGYTTAKYWPKLSTAGKVAAVAVDVLVLLPVLRAVARGIKLSAVKIPMAKGEVTVWRGLSVGQRPVIGMSRGKLVIGARNISYPEAKMILKGYEPITVLETKVVANPTALKAMGFSKSEIDKLILTLKDRGLFAGKKSPFAPTEVAPEPIKSLSAKGTATVMDKVVRYGGKVDKVYGSTTIKPQLAPELRGWRTPADIDIQTLMGAGDDLTNFVDDIVRALKKTEGAKNVRISKTSPTLIETKVQGHWRHAVDIHSHEVASGLEIAPEGAYGMIHAEPAITVKYKLGDKLYDVQFMRLSESGKRKAASILEIREGTFAPAPHRVKDVADFYVILRTFKGQNIADDWAKVFGYAPDDLLKVSTEAPLDLVGWQFSPGVKVAGVSVGVLPVIQLTPPQSLVASIPAKLAEAISYPISPFVIKSPTVSVGISPSLSRSLLSVPGAGISPSPLILGKTSVSPLMPSMKAVSAKLPMSKPVSGVPSLSAVPSSLVEASPYAKPSPGLSRSLPPSTPPRLKGVPSIPPSPPSAPPSVPPSKTTTTPLRIPPKTTITKLAKDKGKLDERRIAFTSAIGWRQGFGWWMIKHPYASRADVAFFYKQPPPGARIVKGGVGSALRSIQTITGKPPERLVIDMGIMDVVIKRPKASPGESGAIVFRRDIGLKTTGHITLGRRRNGQPKRKGSRIKVPVALATARA